jgi:Zinc knuckle
MSSTKSTLSFNLGIFNGYPPEFLDWVTGIESEFLMDDTLDIALGRPQPPRPVEPAMGVTLADLRAYQNFTHARTAWERNQERLNSKCACSLAKTIQHLGPTVLNAIQALRVATHNRNGELMTNSDRLFEIFCLLNALYLPKIQQFYQILKKKLEISNDSNGMQEHINLMLAVLNQINKLNKNEAPQARIYIDDPADPTGPKIISPNQLQSPYVPTSNELKEWFLAGVTDPEYAALKTSIDLDDAISFNQVVEKFQILYEKIESHKRIKMFTAVNPNDVPVQAYKGRSNQAHATTEAELDQLRKHQSSMQKFSDFRGPHEHIYQSQASAMYGLRPYENDYNGTPPERPYRQPDGYPYGASTQYNAPRCFNCDQRGHRAIDCPALRCSSCSMSWSSQSSPGRHVCTNCPLSRSPRNSNGRRSPNQSQQGYESPGRNNKYPRTSENRGRSNSPSNNRGRSNSPYRASAETNRTSATLARNTAFNGRDFPQQPEPRDEPKDDGGF